MTFTGACHSFDVMPKKILHIALLFSILGLTGCASYHPRVAADPDVFKAVRESIKEEGTYRFTRGFVYSESVDTGRIWTDWFSRHKGEIILKIDAYVTGKEYSVSVLQKGFIIPSKKKTQRSKELEARIIKRIEAAL